MPLTQTVPGPTEVEGARGVRAPGSFVTGGYDVSPNYFNVARIPIVRGRGFDVLTTEEAGRDTASDEEQLAFAAGAGRAILTFNIRDFAPLHEQWRAAGRPHAGMIVSQHSGEGKANQCFVRGFNLDHGTDFQTRLEGIPLNRSTHGHGQGYTDLSFLISAHFLTRVTSSFLQNTPRHASPGGGKGSS